MRTRRARAAGTLSAVGGPLICVIEDEEAIAAAVAARLRAEGFAVEVAADGPAGVALCERLLPDLVVLDLLLRDGGPRGGRRIQRSRPVPVLMLTALDADTDVLVGLGVGADDYMTKPFSMRELSRACARCCGGRAAPAGGRDAAGRELELDPAERRVRVAGATIELTPTEFELLAVLAARPGTVHTREQLLAEVWGWRDGSGTRTVDSHVRGLRRKLGPEWLRTVHGVGYALEVA